MDRHDYLLQVSFFNKLEVIPFSCSALHYFNLTIKKLFHEPLKIFLGASLAVSLSGCAGVNYGNYPTPNAQTCFINPTLVAAKQQGLDNLII